MKDFDDTEIIQAARDTLHRVFAELSAESKQWKLTPQEREFALEQLGACPNNPFFEELVQYDVANLLQLYCILCLKWSICITRTGS
jgi:hypothetical protein